MALIPVKDQQNLIAHDEKEEPPVLVQYPRNQDSYCCLNVIGHAAAHTTVYRAKCLPLKSTLVAIKVIDLGKFTANISKYILREAEAAMSIIPHHPNILRPHCLFTTPDNRSLWVVMPYMSAGSVQSIISSSFTTGLPKPFLAVVLKETLNALSYLHAHDLFHRNIKAGNILLDLDGSVKISDFGIRASNLSDGVDGYWVAPEDICSPLHGFAYKPKKDVWSFGVTALEIAHGCPPVSRIPPSESLIMKMEQRFRLTKQELIQRCKENEGFCFSESFQDLINSCLQKDPSQRPSTECLMKHSFFENCNSSDFLAKNMLKSSDSLEKRSEKQLQQINGRLGRDDGTVYVWNFNKLRLELEPVVEEEEEPQASCQIKERAHTTGGDSERWKHIAEKILRDMTGSLITMQRNADREVAEDMKELVALVGDEDMAKTLVGNIVQVLWGRVKSNMSSGA